MTPYHSTPSRWLATGAAGGTFWRNDMTETNNRRRTAFHEAGHAVTALLLGRPYGCAVHEGGGGLAGPGDLSTPIKTADYTLERMTAVYTSESLEENFRDAVIVAAGVTAVALASFDGLVLVAGPDRTMLTAAANAAFPDGDFETERAFVALAIAHARCLLQRDFNGVERVAEALIERGVLSAEDVKTIYNRSEGRP